MSKPYIQTPREFLEGFVEQYATFANPDKSISGADTVESMGKIYRIAKKVLKAHKKNPASRHTDRELATLLFGLRNLQQDIIGDSQFRATMKNAEHFVGGIKPLSLKEIDLLCRRINHG